MDVFNRIRTALGRPLRPPLDAEPPHGKCEFRGRRCIVTVSDRFNPPTHPLILELRNAQGATLQAGHVSCTDGRSQYGGAIDLIDGIAARDFLIDTVALYIRNAYGLEAKLAVDGASQLTLIREHFGKPRTVLFDLDFTMGGNAEQHLGEGWAGPEPKMRCSDGPRATLQVPAELRADYRHELTIACQPFLFSPRLADQRLLLQLNGYLQQASLDARHLEFFSFTYPEGALSNAEEAVMEFEFPDCFRPADFLINDDRRQLAFGFKQLTLSRLSPVEAGGSHA